MKSSLYMILTVYQGGGRQVLIPLKNILSIEDRGEYRKVYLKKRQIDHNVSEPMEFIVEGLKHVSITSSSNITVGGK